MRHWKMQFNVTSSSGTIECFEFEMIIDNFSKLRDLSTSPAFVSNRYCITTWQIVVDVAVEIRKMRIALKRTDSNSCNVKATMFFEIQNDKSEIYWRDSVEHFYHFQNLRCCYSDYIEIPNRQQYVSGMKGKPFKLSVDKIRIKGNVLIKEQKIGFQAHKVGTECLNESLDQLKRGYKNLYYNSKFSDIEFHFSDGKLQAHKNILSTRSSVFEKIIEENCFQNIIEITDVEKSVFELFLLFLYCGVIENGNADVIIPLYTLAYKYEVFTLAKTCSGILKSEMSVKTAARILELANTHEDEVLREASINFVCANFPRVAQTQEWDKLISTDPPLASSVLKRVSKSLARNK